MAAEKRIGLQSYCFHMVDDVGEMVHLAKEVGASCVELFSSHVRYDSPAGWQEVMDACASAGVEIASCGVNLLTGDREHDRVFFDFQKKAGVSLMSVDFSLENMPDSFLVADALAWEYDVFLAIHSHGRNHWLGSPETVDWVFSKTSPRVGFCMDTCFMLDVGFDPSEVARRFAERLYVVHIKDVAFDERGGASHAVLGEGLLDLDGLITTLEDVGYSGPLLAEYEASSDVEQQRSALTRCIAALRRAVSRR